MHDYFGHPAQWRRVSHKNVAAVVGVNYGDSTILKGELFGSDRDFKEVRMGGALLGSENDDRQIEEWPVDALRVNYGEGAGKSEDTDYVRCKARIECANSR